MHSANLCRDWECTSVLMAGFHCWLSNPSTRYNLHMMKHEHTELCAESIRRVRERQCIGSFPVEWLPLTRHGVLEVVNEGAFWFSNAKLQTRKGNKAVECLFSSKLSSSVHALHGMFVQVSPSSSHSLPCVVELVS